MLYSVKSSRKVKKCETSDLLMTLHGFDDMIVNGEKSSFSRMMFDIDRLVRFNEVVGR